MSKLDPSLASHPDRALCKHIIRQLGVYYGGRKTTRHSRALGNQAASQTCDYRTLPGKCPWALAVQRRKTGGGRLRELPGAYHGTFMR